MGITRIRANTQIKSGSVDSTNIKDKSLIPQDFATFPQQATPMTTVQRDAIANPPQGLQIYNTDSLTVDVYTGTGWVAQLTAVTVPWDGGNADSSFDQVIDGGNA